MSDAAKPFVLAVPSKGRLQENAAQFFARAGLGLVQGRGARDYRGTLAGFDDVEVAFLPVSEIVANLAEGSVHLGVAGEDLLREAMADADDKVAFLTPLGFGYANVVVAVPQAWIDVRTMADLEDVAAIFHARRGHRMRVATKYVALTRRYFALHGVTDYRIVESLGATEGAPAAGSAELIVDITTTGATLAANALKVLDDGIMLRSEANLVAAVRADWTPAHRATALAILSRIAAERLARLTRDVTADFGDTTAPEIPEADLARYGAQALPVGAGGRLTWRCAQEHAAALAGWLIQHGARQVAVTRNEALFEAENPVFEKLSDRLA